MTCIFLYSTSWSLINFSLPYVVHWLLLEILEEKSKTCLLISQCREYGPKLLTVVAKFNEVCTEKIMGRYSPLIFLNKFCYLQCTWMKMLTRYPATMDCYDTLNLRMQFWLINLTQCFLTYNILKEKHKNERESFPYAVAIIIVEK